MSDKNTRVLSIIQENMSNFKDQANLLFQLDKKIQQKLGVVSNKLIPFIQQNCKEEYSALLTKFKIVESSTYGSQIVPIDLAQKDMSLLNHVERCVDRYTGINKLITMYEIDSRNTRLEDDKCKRRCIDKSEGLNDSELTKCLTDCYEGFYRTSIQLAEDFETQLNKINLKI
jgi:hypothetical protein